MAIKIYLRHKAQPPPAAMKLTANINRIGEALGYKIPSPRQGSESKTNIAGPMSPWSISPPTKVRIKENIAKLNQISVCFIRIAPFLFSHTKIPDLSAAPPRELLKDSIQ